MHDYTEPKDPHESIRTKINELESRGFQVNLTRHRGSRLHARNYCRIRNQQSDLTFFGKTKEMAITKALESLDRKTDEATTPM